MSSESAQVIGIPNTDTLPCKGQRIKKVSVQVCRCINRQKGR